MCWVGGELEEIFGVYYVWLFVVDQIVEVLWMYGLVCVLCEVGDVVLFGFWDVFVVQFLQLVGGLVGLFEIEQVGVEDLVQCDFVKF